MKNISNRALTAATALALLAWPAAAGGRKAAPQALPGVDRAAGTASAAAPRPEPDDTLPAGSRPGSIRAGDWEITISGSISYEIGSGRAMHGR